MKHLFTLILALMLPLMGVSADGLDALRSTLASGKSVTVEYSFVAEKGTACFGGEGVVTLQGKCYRLQSEMLDVYCDGTRQWTVNKMADELIVESAPDKDFIADPVTLLSLVGLNPKAADIKVNDRPDGTLKSLEVRTKDGMVIVLDIENMAVAPAIEHREFQFDSSSLDSNWVITDLT